MRIETIQFILSAARVAISESVSLTVLHFHLGRLDTLIIDGDLPYPYNETYIAILNDLRKKLESLK